MPLGVGRAGLLELALGELRQGVGDRPVDADDHLDAGGGEGPEGLGPAVSRYHDLDSALGDRLRRLSKVYVVDLTPSLLEVARRRIAREGWANVQTVEADVTAFVPPGQSADVVTFSYSLTMIPDWFAAIQNAIQMLKPGGRIGVVDFYVSRKHPESGLAHHGWFTRNFWPVWFGNDNVFPSSDHLPFLRRRLQTQHLEEHRAKIPYLPGMRAPYYIYVGQKSPAGG